MKNIKISAPESTRKKKRILTAVRMIAFALVLFLVLSATYKSLSWKNTLGGYLSSVEQMYNTQENLVDVVFLGSSHTYCGIFPSVLWEEKGIAAFDMSVSGQDKDSTYHDLVEILKTQSPKVVFVDLFGLTFDKHGIQGNVYRNYLSLKTSANSINLVRSYIEDKDEQLEYIFRWPIVHTRYRELEKHDFVQYAPSTFGRGNVVDWRITPVDFTGSLSDYEETCELQPKNEKWIYDLIDLSKEEGFDLIFMVLPFYIDSYEVQGQINKVGQIAQENGAGFYDFNKMLDQFRFDENKDYLDAAHLNAYGAVKMTKYVGEEILAKYDLADHRGDAAYFQWDLDLEWYYLLEAENKLTYVNDITEYLSIIVANPKLTAIVSLEGPHAEGERDYVTPLSVLGISADEGAAGGKWLYRNGSVSKILDNVEGQEYLLELSETNTLRVSFNSLYSPTNIVIGKRTCQLCGYHMTIVVYDEMVGEYITSKGF